MGKATRKVSSKKKPTKKEERKAPTEGKRKNGETVYAMIDPVTNVFTRYVRR